MNKYICYKKIIDDSLGPLIHQIDHILYLKQNNQLNEIGITFQQARVLLFILIEGEEGKVINQKDIEEHMCLKGSTVTSLIKNMIDKELIVKTKNLNDGRYYNLSVTKKGVEINEVSFEIFKNLNLKIRENISEEDVDLFKVIVNKILKNIGE